MRLMEVVRLLATCNGRVLRNTSLVVQLVELARREDLLQDGGSQPPVVRFCGNAHERTCSPHNRAVKLGRKLSRLMSSSTNREDMPGTSEPPLSRVISDSEVGYASRLPRQGSLAPDLKIICALSDLRDGKLDIHDGTYLYVIMVGDAEHIRLLHEDHLVHEGVMAGHSSLVERCEFKRSWTQQWEDGDPDFRHTVLYAGELDYCRGEGVTMWNNHSGHYTPEGKDHVRVALDPATFVAVDE
eukprot:TRINITY_DN12880_c0_g1_i1.p1 TRINITY_DN12880_c0_g1~~TRINITY_DN12880_c0_g1_i1.p1  ORF type:complete len:242 (+),score=23.14 TRINITY_DN12880_c0_g1_i1:87-812(+)